MSPILRLGILGATDTVESTHLPALHALSTQFELTILHDASSEALQRCQKRFNIKETTTSAADVLNHPQVDLVLNLLPFEYHEQHTIAALEAGKHVMVEIPLSLGIDGLRRIRAATKKGSVNSTVEGGPKVFVGCARRYAPCFTDIFKKEVASIDRIYYARCRNIAGPLQLPDQKAAKKGDSNGTGFNLSLNGNTNGKNNTNGSLTVPNTIINTTKFHTLLADIFNVDDLTAERVAFCRFLGTRGAHDLSLMRELFGFPDAVASISITDPFYSGIFHYTDNAEDGNTFTMLYEAGVDAVPRCDSHLTVYGSGKTVSLEYNFPCPGATCGEGVMSVVVEEAEKPENIEAAVNGNTNGHSLDGNVNGDGVCNSLSWPRAKRTVYTSTAADAYEKQFRAMYSYFVSGDAPDAKTTTEDALDDLKLVHMIFEHYDRQCGTIRTPLG
ncbi:hypothetical protein N7532_008876 [Penicillium argentinense]|uniref:Gfo/Idh/MocA-like oxidoreductase N-terminal domain-containing protein n=1 Tax=Penicillium argentinense TaxID=1131581 RepID=A0A9W9EY79_9EURO|nr:uncharacterized protein N7532_008876 [Penicillium argentinense]KAJ5090192.1 hypothetical protein N7532_008876 [Penicillium argentinense]